MQSVPPGTSATVIDLEGWLTKTGLCLPKHPRPGLLPWPVRVSLRHASPAVDSCWDLWLVYYPATTAIQQVPQEDLLVHAPAEFSVVNTEAKQRWNKALLCSRLSNSLNIMILQQMLFAWNRNQHGKDAARHRLLLFLDFICGSRRRVTVT